MPSLPVKIGIVIVGLVLYFFAISALLNIRRDKSQQRVLFDSIDYDRDGILTTNQINTFHPCPTSNKTNLIARLHTLGTRVSYDQFENDVSRNMIKSTIAPCAANAHLLASPTQLSKRTAANAVGPFFRLYDLDQDGVVTWNEYNLINKYHGKTIKGVSDTFDFLDKNNDWEITRQEFLAANLKELDPMLVGFTQNQSSQSQQQQRTNPNEQPRYHNTDPNYNNRYDQRQRDPYYNDYVEPTTSSRQRASYRADPQPSYRDPTDPYYQDPYYQPRARRYDSEPRRRQPVRDAYSQRQQYYDQGL